MYDEFSQSVTKSFADFIAQVRKGELTDTDLAYLALDHSGIIANRHDISYLHIQKIF
jgi:hypothetical protein